ncbi:hypothetical protein BWR17_19475 (plasmid) [Phaeobacter inhibens]|nr:hypothetical protein BWR17_19475 [Phaeobacter inhibens]
MVGLASNPFLNIIAGGASVVFAGFLKALFGTSSPEAPKPGIQDFVDIKDFDPSQDILTYSSKVDGSQYLAEDYDTGVLEIYTDQTTINSGGILAKAVLDDEFIDTISQNTSLNARSVRQQVAEQLSDSAIKIVKKNGALVDENGNQFTSSDAAVQAELTRIADELKDDQGVALYGNAGPRLLQGGDISSAGITNEVFVVGGSAGDTLYGGTVSNAGSSNDIAHIFGFDGDDIIHGTDGNDFLHGGKDSDEIHGGAGNDKIYSDSGVSQENSPGQRGVDDLWGGSGSDEFIFGRESSANIKDFEDNVDKIIFTGGGSFEDITFIPVGGGNGTLLLSSANGWAINIENVNDASLLTADDFLFT